jgi:hypothetical protein
MKSDYHRSTRECALAELKPELNQAIHEYLSRQRLSNVEVEVLMCCETISEKKPIGSLEAFLGGDPDTILHTGMLVTPHWLVWARSGDKTGTIVQSAQLQDIKAQVYSSQLVKDNGLELYGYIGNSTRRVRGYIGLGPEEAAQKFCQTVIEAIDKATPKKPPLKRRVKFFGWK